MRAPHPAQQRRSEAVEGDACALGQHARVASLVARRARTGERTASGRKRAQAAPLAAWLTRARPRARASLWQSEASLASAEALLAARLGAVRGARGGARVLGQEAAAGAADQGGALAQGITDDFDQEEDSDLGSDGFEP